MTAKWLAEPADGLKKIAERKQAKGTGKTAKPKERKTRGQPVSGEQPIEGLNIELKPRISGQLVLTKKGRGSRKKSRTVSVPIPEKIAERLDAELVGVQGQGLSALIVFAIQELDKRHQTLEVSFS
jgi:hypothetical protein